MQSFGGLAVTIGHSLSGMALAVVCHGILQRAYLHPTLTSLLIGGTFGLAGSLMLSTPMHAAEGVMLDGAPVIVGLAGAFGGIPASVVAALIVAGMKASLGGQGAWIGVAFVVSAGVAGSTWNYVVMGRSKPSGASLAMLGAILSTNVISIAFIPIPNAMSLMINTWFGILPIYIFSCIVFGLIMSRETALIERENALRALSSVDHLTNLPNRRCFSDHLQAACRREKEGGDGFSVLMIDIDHFKDVNDRLGHDVGDQALRAVAEVLKRDVSKADLSCRYGGEEFAVFLLYSSPNQAFDKGERLRRRIEALTLEHAGQSFGITVSVGVANSYGHDHDAASIMKKADEALYKAKRTGRNKVVSSELTDRGTTQSRMELASAA